MAQLFIDSFSGYRTADLSTRYPGGTVGFGQAAIGNGFLPPNPQAGAQVFTTNGGGALSQNFGPMNRTIVGFRLGINFSAGFGNSNTIMLFYFGMSPSVGSSIFVSPAGTFFRDNFGTAILSGPVIPQTEWHHLEFDIVWSTTATGSVKMYLDGSPTPVASATNIITVGSGTTKPSQIAIGNNNGNGNSSNLYYADYYVFDGTGAAPFNAPLAPQGLGAPKTAFAVANGVGIISNWTANGAATIWQSINQIPQDGDTTYASDVTPGDQYQCTFAALPAMQTLISAQLSTYARTDDAGPRAYQSGFYKGGTYGYSGVDQYLGGSYNYIEDEFPVNPVTGLAWVPGDLTGLQFGARLTI